MYQFSRIPPSDESQHYMISVERVSAKVDLRERTFLWRATVQALTSQTVSRLSIPSLVFPLQLYSSKRSILISALNHLILCPFPSSAVLVILFKNNFNLDDDGPSPSDIDYCPFIPCSFDCSNTKNWSVQSLVCSLAFSWFFSDRTGKVQIISPLCFLSPTSTGLLLLPTL